MLSLPTLLPLLRVQGVTISPAIGTTDVTLPQGGTDHCKEWTQSKVNRIPYIIAYL
jgi:hypothetical protein